MLVYICILFLLLFGVFHFEFRKRKYFDGVYYIILYILCTLMVGLRYRVGGDALMYEDYYWFLPDLSSYRFSLSDNTLGYQPLYLLFVSLCKGFSSDYYFYQFVHSVVVNTVLFWFIKKYAGNTKYTVIFMMYIFLLYFYFTFDIQREMLAICCFLLGYKYFENNRWHLFYIYAVLGFLFHISAAILLLLPIFKTVRLTKRLAIIILIITFPLIFAKQFFFNYLSIFMLTETMKSKAEVYSRMDFSLFGTFAFYMVRVVIILPFIFTSISNKSRKWDWLIFYMLTFSILSQVFVGMERLLNYVYIIYIIFIVDSIRQYKKQKEYYGINRFSINLAVLGLFFILNFKIVLDANVIDRARYQAVFFPYESILDKKQTPERERFMIELWDR